MKPVNYNLNHVQINARLTLSNSSPTLSKKGIANLNFNIITHDQRILLYTIRIKQYTDNHHR